MKMPDCWKSHVTAHLCMQVSSPDLPSSHHLNMAAACSSQGEKATGERETEREREIEQEEQSTT